MKDLHPDIVELLLLRATEGLSDEQHERLRALLNEHGLNDIPDYDLSAAAAANAFALQHAQDDEEAPSSLKAKLLDDADTFFGDARGNVVDLPMRRPAANAGRNWGWAAAAALALALVMTNLDTFDSSRPDFAEAREQLIATSDATQVIPWASPEDPAFAQVTGDVVWNDDLQEGYLLLTGMPVNDPSVAQYQLWVVDPDRDSNPVDGGVFDIPSGQQSVVIPINAKLAVDDPTVFAITREQPGGVVVSKGPLLVIASAG